MCDSRWHVGISKNAKYSRYPRLQYAALWLHLSSPGRYRIGGEPNETRCRLGRLAAFALDGVTGPPSIDLKRSIR